MIIKKTNEEDTYLERVTRYEFEADGKKVRAWYSVKQDEETGNYESDTEVSGEDLKQFSEDEAEMIEENIHDAIALEVGSELTLI